MNKIREVLCCLDPRQTGITTFPSLYTYILLSKASEQHNLIPQRGENTLAILVMSIATNHVIKWSNYTFNLVAKQKQGIESSFVVHVRHQDRPM
jgi:hypothetical protein